MAYERSKVEAALKAAHAAGDQSAASKLTGWLQDNPVDAQSSESQSTTKSKREPISQGTSAGLGTQQGVLFNWADEINAAGYNAGFPHPRGFKGENYQEYLDEDRQNFHHAEQDNSGTFLAGEVVGSLIAPGLGLAKGATTLAKTAAVYGAVEGAGISQEEDPLDVALDSVLGATIGGTLGKATSVIGRLGQKGGSKIKDLAVKKLTGGKGLYENGQIWKGVQADWKKAGLMAADGVWEGATGRPISGLLKISQAKFSAFVRTPARALLSAFKKKGGKVDDEAAFIADVEKAQTEITSKLDITPGSKNARPDSPQPIPDEPGRIGVDASRYDDRLPNPDRIGSFAGSKGVRPVRRADGTLVPPPSTVKTDYLKRLDRYKEEEVLGNHVPTSQQREAGRLETIASIERADIARAEKAAKVISDKKAKKRADKKAEKKVHKKDAKSEKRRRKIFKKVLGDDKSTKDKYL